MVFSYVGGLFACYLCLEWSVSLVLIEGEFEGRGVFVGIIGWMVGYFNGKVWWGVLVGWARSG